MYDFRVYPINILTIAKLDRYFKVLVTWYQLVKNI